MQQHASRSQKSNNDSEQEMDVVNSLFTDMTGSIIRTINMLAHLQNTMARAEENKFQPEAVDASPVAGRALNDHSLAHDDHDNSQ